MKKSAPLLLAPLFAAGAMIFSQTSCSRADGQTPGTLREAPTSPPLGTKCSLKLYRESDASSNLSNAEITGTLTSTSGDWVCVNEGSTEHWVPKARILELKLSR